MIDLKKITKSFGEKKILSKVTQSFAKNKITSILGPSGSGKTTLIRCINGLETPDSGEILFSGTKITTKNQKYYSKKISVVFQNFELFPHMSALQNAIYAPVILKIYNRQDAISRAEKFFDEFGIISKKDFMPFNLSGGQKQKVAIIRSLMINPEVMVFDEPTSALDPESIQDLVAALEGLRGVITIIIVTHHLRFAKKISDTIVFMDQGQILCAQPTDEFFGSPKSIRAKMFIDAVEDYM